MNFLRRFDNRVLIKDDPAKMGKSVEAETSDGNGGNDSSINVLNQDPDEYEVDASPAMSKSIITPVKQSSQKKLSYDGSTPDGRKETPRLFQRKLFQKTPPKTDQKGQSPGESYKDSENNDNTIPSAHENGNRLNEGSTGTTSTNHSPAQTSEPPNDNEQKQDSSHERTQQNSQQVSHGPRTLEPWENWDEDFYSLLSTTMDFVSYSAMTLTSALASASSKLTDDLIVEAGNSDDDDDDDSIISATSKPKSVHVSNLNEDNLLEDETSVLIRDPSLDRASNLSFNSNTPLEEKYNNIFTLNFIKELAHIGLVLTYYDTSNDDLKSNLVLMTIDPGTKEETQLLEPKVSWVQMRDGKETTSTKQSVKILDIHSVTAPGSECLSADEGTGLHFIITTETGTVHVFECVTASDRDRVMYGLRNVISWLSYNLLMGSLVVSHLAEEGNKEYAISLGSQLKSMNHLIAPFLD